MGDLYQAGAGVPQSDSKSAEWYRKSAYAGYPLAQSNLATLYAIGKGVEKDPTEAYAWYELAIEGGLTEAQVLQQQYLSQLNQADSSYEPPDFSKMVHCSRNAVTVASCFWKTHADMEC